MGYWLEYNINQTSVVVKLFQVFCDNRAGCVVIPRLFASESKGIDKALFSVRISQRAACPFNSRTRLLLMNGKARFSAIGLLGVPEVYLVLDTLSSGAVLEFLEGA